MSGLLAELNAIAKAAFAAEGFSEAFGQVQASDRPDLAQFQCNGALSAAKIAKTNPRAIAEKLAARLKSEPIFAKVEIAGPGFINLDLTDEALAVRMGTMAKDVTLSAPRTGEGKVLVIDFGGPNIAKPMHVGHLRSAIIGDSLQRLFRANGWRVTSDVHLGRLGPADGPAHQRDRPPRRRAYLFRRRLRRSVPGAITGDDGRSGGDLSGSRRRLQSRSGTAGRGTPATAELQAGARRLRALWKHFFEVSQIGLDREYESLGVHFDLWKGEASVDPLIPQLIEGLKAKGLAVESDGALIVPVAEPDDKKEMPPVILVKSDGAVNYAHHRSRHHRRPGGGAEPRSRSLHRRPAPASAFRAGLPRPRERPD